MGIINKLDLQVANLIAAGEVVDRPASVVKELLENSIDAGAKSITVEIKRGGSSLIRVTDDGAGMSGDDVPVCILRHATSKIKNAADLDGITTLGFRGEALAAIASVSHLRILTRTKGEQMGTVLEAYSGEVSEVTRSGCQLGTSVIVEELFANVPARRKFLKRDVTEGMACAAVVEKLALSHPAIAFKLISDGALRFSSSGDGKLLNTIYAVLGREFAAKLTEVRSLTEGVEVTGYIGRPDNVRANRNYQNFFINGRYVKSRTVMSALEQAYDSFIPQDKFPCCVLNVVLHPAFVDVNVHPTKLEVKFSDERVVFDSVYAAVRNTLCRQTDRPSVNIRANSVSEEDIRLASAFVPVRDRADTPIKSRFEQNRILDTAGATDAFVRHDEQRKAPTEPAPAVESEIPQTPAMPEETSAKATANTERVDYANIDAHRAQQISEPAKKREYRIIGEAFNAYVIVEVDEKILMIDKHAAHERIIFEQMKRNCASGRGSAQLLLMPTLVRLEANEYAALCGILDKLGAMGFCLSPDEPTHSLAMTGFPSELTEAAALDMLNVLGEQLARGTGNEELTREQFYEKVLYQASCKAAIKAGHIEDAGHVKWICDNLLALPDIKFCPHGRPVAMELTMRDIEHQFGRI